MLKSKLIKLVNLYTSKLGQNEKEDARITALKMYLETHKQPEINFSDFIDSPHGGLEVQSQITEAFLNSHHPAAFVFSAFIFPLKKLPEELVHAICDFLDLKSINKLIGTSTFFKPITKTPYWQYWKTALFWKKKLRVLCPKVSWDEIIGTEIIENLEHLYNVLMQMRFAAPSIDTTWEIYMLCGETIAIDYAIDTFNLDKYKQNRWHENIFHQIVFSGEVLGVEHIIKRFPDINMQQTTEGARNLFHLAIWSGSVDMVRYVRFLANKHHFTITLYNVNSENDNAFTYVAKRHNDQDKIQKIRQALTEPIESIVTWALQKVSINIKKHKRDEFKHEKSNKRIRL